MAYALILEPSASRAAQYAFRTELAKLTPVTCRTGAEALFQVERLGPPALIIAESTLPDGDGLTILRALRQLVPVEKARALLVVDTKQAHDAAARQMIQLGISALVLPSQSIPALEKAIANALAGRPQPDTLPPPPDARVPTPPPGIPRASPPSPFADAAAALAVAERMAEDPLVSELATLPLFDEPGDEESLARAATSTARAFGAPIGLLWVTRGERSWFKLHGKDGLEALRAPVLWTALRGAIGSQAVHVPDAPAVPGLAAEAVVRRGVVGSFAGAPLFGTDGQLIGAVAIAHPAAGGIAQSAVEPLLFWAGRIASELAARGPRPRRPGGSEITAAIAIESAMATLASAVLVSDRNGVVSFSNPALKALFGLRVVRVAGLRREDVIRTIAASSGASNDVVEAIGEAEGAPPPLEFQVSRPRPRVLRWESRPITLAAQTGRFDEFRDVTAEAARMAALSGVDPLSGLPDRSGADDALGREVSRSLRTGQPLGIALFEVDGLDRRPPELADRILRAVAWVLRESVRGYDIAARFAPRQLLAVLPGATEKAMHGFGQRFCKEVREMRVEGLPPATVSGGAAEFDPATTVDVLLDAATSRLQQAKAQGGDRTS